MDFSDVELELDHRFKVRLCQDSPATLYLPYQVFTSEEWCWALGQMSSRPVLPQALVWADGPGSAPGQQPLPAHAVWSSWPQPRAALDGQMSHTTRILLHPEAIWNECMHVCMLLQLCPALCNSPWGSPGKNTQVLKEYLKEFLSPGDLPHPGIEPVCPGPPALQVDSLPPSHLGSP